MNDDPQEKDLTTPPPVIHTHPVPGAGGGASPYSVAGAGSVDTPAVLMGHGERLARLETGKELTDQRVSGLERSLLVVSGQLQGVQTEQRQLGDRFDDLKNGLMEVLSRLQSLEKGVREVGETATKIQSEWGPTIQAVVPLIEEKKTEAILLKRRADDWRWRGEWTQRLLTFMGVITSLVGAAATLSHWGDLTTLVRANPFVVLLGAACVLAFAAFILKDGAASPRA